MNPWFHHATWLGNPIHAWIFAGIGALVGYIVVYGAVRILAARLRTLSTHHPRSTPLSLCAAVADATRAWVLALLAIVIALHTLHFPPTLDARLRWMVGKTGTVDDALSWLIGALVSILIAYWVSTLIIAWLKRATPDGGMQKSNPVIFGILTWAVELTVWVTLLLILLSNAGVHIGAFIASLGVGGIAVAMAAKNVLQDLFASIAIGLDKPFTVGEFIAFGTESGTVTKVGIKSTRIASASGEELTINNSGLLQQLVHNYSRMQERRVTFGFRVPLDTPGDTATAIADATKNIIRDIGTDKVRLDRGHLLAIEPEGLRYEFVYYVLTSGYNDYCDIQQAINLGIMAKLETLGVLFAAPTTRLVRKPQHPANHASRPLAGDAR